MSGWDWIHAGLEVATYAQAQKAQRNLEAMRTAGEIEEARRALLEAMKSFIFDISRDIQLAEEQLDAYPQQVYIVSKSLEYRLSNSGLSAEAFPDLEDKEYIFKTQKKIAGVVKKSKAGLSARQAKESDVAVQYIVEMPVLQEAIAAKSAHDSLLASEAQWRKLSSRNGNKKLLRWLGIAGLVVGLCLACPLLTFGGGLVGIGDFASVAGGLVMLAIAGGIPLGSIVFIILGSRSNPEFAPLKANREAWQQQLLSQEEWGQVVATFGDLTTEGFQQVYQERIAYLNPLLGGDFQKYLAAGE